MTAAARFLRENPEWAYLLFLLGSGLASELLRRRSPAEEARLRRRFPRVVAVRDLARGLGWDVPTIRAALSLLLLGRSLEPELPPLTPPPGEPRGERAPGDSRHRP